MVDVQMVGATLTDGEDERQVVDEDEMAMTVVFLCSQPVSYRHESCSPFQNEDVLSAPEKAAEKQGPVRACPDGCCVNAFEVRSAFASGVPGRRLGLGSAMPRAATRAPMASWTEYRQLSERAASRDASDAE